MTRSRQPRPRPGFTLIELLIVIAIIAVLAGLTIAAVTRVQEKGRELGARNDLSGLEAALGTHKSKFGASIPCIGGGTDSSNNVNGTFRLCSAYQDSGGGWIS